jgi:plasmid stability protein
MNDGGRIEEMERRIAALEKAVMGKETQEVLELDLTLPEADINGLHFNKQEVRAVFEKRADGWYHSLGILFMSARNSKDDNSRDILTDYLQSEAVHDAFLAALDMECKNIGISLPKENAGVRKKYNGADCWYWLADRYFGSAAFFCGVYHYGTLYHYASAVGGVAPMFRVLEEEEGRE